MNSNSTFLTVVMTLIFGAFTATQAQTDEPPPTPTPPPVQVAADSNPVQEVFFQVRSEYVNLNGNNWTQATIIRSDKGILKKSRFGGRVGVLTRFDLPFVTTKLGTSTQAGLGDIYLQAVHIPILNKKRGFFFGSGLSVPTATYRTLGTGKWMLAPLAGPLWFFGRGNLAFIKFQQFISIAGNSSRPDLSFLLVTPTIRWRLPNKSWVLVTAESRTNFKPVKTTWYKAGIQLGHVVSPKVAIWGQPEVYFGPSRPASFGLKFSLVWNR